MGTLAVLLALAALLVPGAAGRPEPEAPEYVLHVRLLPAEQKLEVSGTVRIPAATRVRSELSFQLIDRTSDLKLEVIEPPASAGAAIIESTATTGTPDFSARGNVRWKLRPVKPIPAGEPVRLRFSYTGSGKTALIYSVGPEVAFASGWGDDWYPMVDSVGGMGTGELTIQAPAEWKVFQGSPRLRTYFTFASGPYTVTSRGGRIPLAEWLLTPRAHSPSHLAGVARMLDVLSAEFGPYPFDSLTLIEVPRARAQEAGFNAFSPAGFLVLNSRAFDRPDVDHQLEWLGHELSHQWFPHAVIWDHPGFLYLEEALAEYGGHRVVEELGGPEAARRLRMSGFEYDPIYSATAYFKMVSEGKDEPLAGMRAGLDQRNLAYNKGALIFDMLSREVGRERFREILKGLTRGRRLQTVTWREFLARVDAGAGRKLAWFFDQWLDRAGAPDYQLAWRQEGHRLHGTITQSAPYYRAHLKIEMRGGSGERAQRTVEITGRRADFSAAIPFRAKSALLDPDYEVLRWTPEYHALVDSLRHAGK